MAVNAPRAAHESADKRVNIFVRLDIRTNTTSVAGQAGGMIMWGRLFCGDDLKESVRKGNLKRVKRLVSKGVTIEDLNMALHTVVWLGKADIVTYLLEQGAPVDGPSPDHHTLLIIALCSKLSLPAALPLIAYGANPNARCPYGKTTLMYAVDTNNLEIVEALLENGAEVNAVDNEGATALEYVRTPEMMTLLRQYGAKYSL